MRQKIKTYTLDALDADGFFNNVTGDISATAWTTANSALTDGCAHYVSLASSADLHAITFTFTGTDAEGRTQTESSIGPNNTTIYLTKYFKTITSVTSSATLGANTLDVGWTGAAHTPCIPVDCHAGNGAAVGCDISGTISYTVQNTNDDIWNDQTPSWYDLIDARTTDWYGTAEPGSTGVRVAIASHTSGVVIFTVSQGA
jgi:hypothetical protein